MQPDVLSPEGLRQLLVQPGGGRGEVLVVAGIDPDLADWLLGRYFRRPGRPLAPATVARIEDALRQADPEQTYEEVLIAPDGVVFAGKHLLFAIRGAGVAAPRVTVRIGVAPPPWVPQDPDGADLFR